MSDMQPVLAYITMGWGQILIIMVLILLLFGRGKISELMGDVAKGIKSFRKGLSEEEDAAKTEAAKGIENAAAAKEPARAAPGETKV